MLRNELGEKLRVICGHASRPPTGAVYSSVYLDLQGDQLVVQGQLVGHILSRNSDGAAQLVNL